MLEQLINNLGTGALAEAALSFATNAAGALTFLVVSWIAAGWVGRLVRRGFTKAAIDDTLGIFLSNAAEVVRALARFRKELYNLENALAAEPEALEELLGRAQSLRHSLQPDTPATEKPSSPKRRAAAKRSPRRRGK